MSLVIALHVLYLVPCVCLQLEVIVLQIKQDWLWLVWSEEIPTGHVQNNVLRIDKHQAQCRSIEFYI